MMPTPGSGELKNPLPPPTSRFRCRLRASHKEALERVLPLVEVQRGSPCSFEEVFGRKAPLYLEIGSGSGEFLYQTALSNPEVDFIGIEFFLTGVAKLLRRLIDYGRLERPFPGNIRIIPGDARIIIPETIPDGSLDGIFILFPDPWPKKRHHKRRLITVEFLKMLQRKMKDNGLLIITTDNEDYALWIEGSLREAGMSLLMDNSITEPLAGLRADIFSTKYAKEAIASGRRIFTFKAIKDRRIETISAVL